jgi:hypothetical protein
MENNKADGKVPHSISARLAQMPMLPKLPNSYLAHFAITVRIEFSFRPPEDTKKK